MNNERKKEKMNFISAEGEQRRRERRERKEVLSLKA
jgi:hypothetical protein